MLLIDNVWGFFALITNHPLLFVITLGKLLKIVIAKTESEWNTEVLLPTRPFVFQPGHLIFENCISKQAINQADFSTLKILGQSDHWFKSYGQKYNFLLTKSQLFGYNFWTTGPNDLKFWVW